MPPDLKHAMSRRNRDFYLYLLLSLVIALGTGAVAYGYTAWSGLRLLRQSGERALNRHADKLEREIGKFGLLPLTASLNGEIGDFLTEHPTAARTHRINAYLKTLNDSVGSLQTFLVNARGDIVASSNWTRADTFVGRNISYRPYVQAAQPGRITSYYGVGTTDDRPGYYLATAVERDDTRLGVVAIKVGLEQLEHLWLGNEQPVLLSDANGVVVLSSMPQWKYHVLGAMDRQSRQQVNASQQYNGHPLHPLQWRWLRGIGDEDGLVQIHDRGAWRTYLAVTRRLPALSMRFTVLSDPHEVYRLAIARAVAAAVLAAFAMAVLHALNQWRLSISERLSAQAALQAAHAQLETLVEQRSAELRAANAGLHREIAERIQAARQLENVQQELIRTENLAVIGQLSAGLAHEINQPLAALGTLSANAVRFLDRNDLETVRFNLGRITELVARMGVLTGQLRSFARRSSGELGDVAVAASIDSAAALLGHRLRGEPPVRLVQHPPAVPLRARCDAIRLEQVLVNLISNAIDATADTATPQIEVRWYAHEGRVRIEVSDNGPGLSDEVRQRLFEPFFTTKTHSGLGLGLAISADIVKGFGGSLHAVNAAAGGAVFTLDLAKTGATDEESQP